MGLLGRAGMVAARAADLRSPAGAGPGRDGRTALTVAGTGRIRTGDLVVWLKPVAVTPAVVRRDGRVQAAGHPADHARLGLAEDLLDELCGSAGTNDENARQRVLEEKVKGAARRALTPALAIRLTVLMTLMPDADYAEVMAVLLGDLAAVPWQRPCQVPTATVAGTWREALGPRPLERLRDRLLAGVDAGHRGHDYRAVMAGDLEVCSIDGSLIRVPDSDANRKGTHVLIRVRDGLTLRRCGDFLPDGSYLAEISGGALTLTVRVIEYTVTVAGRAAPELFCLITDLLDHDAYPACELAEAYHWRWVGSETALKEAKSAITGAGPSTGPILRSQSPALIAQEHAAWVISVELARATARAAAAVAIPARKGRRAWPLRASPGDLLHRRPPRHHRRHLLRSGNSEPARRADHGQPGSRAGRPGPPPRRHRPRPAPRPQDQGPSRLPARQAPACPPASLPPRSASASRWPPDPPSRNPPARGTGRRPGATPGYQHARRPQSLSVDTPEIYAAMPAAVDHAELHGIGP